MKSAEFISDCNVFIEKRNKVESCFILNNSLPEVVFAEGFSHFRFDELDWALSSDFWPAIQELCAISGDDWLLVAVVDPNPLNYYKKEFDLYNWVEISTSASKDEYWEIINRHPDYSPADSILINSEKIVWLPNSEKWAVWGERAFETCVLGYRDAKMSRLGGELDWALRKRFPLTFKDRIIPNSFSEEIIKNYGPLKLE